jgi:predicted Zn-dependent protease
MTFFSNELYFEKCQKTTLKVTKYNGFDENTIVEQGVGLRENSGKSSKYQYSTEVDFKKLKSVANSIAKHQSSDWITSVETSVGVDFEKQNHHVCDALRLSNTNDSTINSIKHTLIAKNKCVLNNLGKLQSWQEIKGYINISVQTSVGILSELIDSGDSVDDTVTNITTTIKKLHQEAANLKKAVRIKRGYYSVIIGNGSGGLLIHEVFGHLLESSCIHNRKSIFNDKLGNRVTTYPLTVLDDPTLQGLAGSYVYDDEGMLAYPRKLVSNGHISDFLIDNNSAQFMETKSNASARRQNFKFPASSRMSNTYLLNGQNISSHMIEEVGDGVYIESFFGGTVQPLTGNFTFRVRQAKLIRNGKLAAPLEPFIIIGNVVDLLSNIIQVGDDLAHKLATCRGLSGNMLVTVGQPHILINKLFLNGV